MLCVSRKKNEVICIGDDIRITIASVCGGIVKVGIDAPKHIKVDREEVRLKIEAEQAAVDSDCD